jgi:hypothetical protein
MANLDITNIDNACVEREGGKFRDETLTFAAADTFAKGTILARRVVALAPVIGTITRAGTSNGTVTAAAVVDGPVPLVGAYVLTCIEAIANGGVWKLVDPNGGLVSGYLLMTAGAGAATTFETGGLQFIVTDGTNNFEVGDTVTITVAADGKLVPYNPATGAGGEQIPVAVLTYAVTKASSGDVAIRALVAGEVNKTRLVIDAGTTITNAHLDLLRSIGIVPINVQQLGSLDNQ